MRIGSGNMTPDHNRVAGLGDRNRDMRRETTFRCRRNQDCERICPHECDRSGVIPYAEVFRDVHRLVTVYSFANQRISAQGCGGTAKPRP